MAGGVVEEVGMVLLADRVAIVLIETHTMGLDVDNLELIFKISTFMSTIIINCKILGIYRMLHVLPRHHPEY